MPVEVFYSYSHKDEELRAALEAHLAALKRGGWITEWHDRKIGAGSEWQGEIDTHLRRADLILLLISSDFLASDYCYDVELKIALERHDRGEAVVVPIILRPVDWAGTPFARLQALPKDARPVTVWPNADEAFANIAAGLRAAIQRRATQPRTEPAPPAVPEPQPRVLDAALPKYVTVGRTAELLAMVRTTDSGGLRAIVQVEEDFGVGPEDVRSREFTLEFPFDAAGAPAPTTVTLFVNAPNFDPPHQNKRISVPPNGDSKVCQFFLVPEQSGELAVMVELLVGDVYQTARTLRTTAGAAQPSIASPFGIVSFTLYTTSAPKPVARSATAHAGAPAASVAAPPAAPAKSVQRKLDRVRQPRCYEPDAEEEEPPASFPGAESAPTPAKEAGEFTKVFGGGPSDAAARNEQTGSFTPEELRAAAAAPEPPAPVPVGAPPASSRQAPPEPRLISHRLLWIALIIVAGSIVATDYRAVANFAVNVVARPVKQLVNAISK